MNLRRSAPAIAAGILAVGVAAPALAEGSFTSSMSGWLTGLETRDWNDNNTDNVGTQFGAKQCDYDTAGVDVSSIDMELNRNDTFTPDEHYGAKRITCSPNSSLHTVNWGDKGKGNFDMTLKKIDGQVTSTKGKLYVKYLKITY